MFKGLVPSLVAAGIILAAPAYVHADEYGIDVDHSSVGFVTRHLAVVNVPGQFHEYEGELSYDGEDISSLKLNLVVKAESIDTANEDRDDHLRSEDFFEVDTYPEISFNTERVETRDEKIYLIGELTIKNTTRTVELPVALEGPVEDPWGNQRVGLEISGSIDRNDYGVGFDGMADRTIGSTVRLDVNIQGIKAQDE